MTTATIQTNDEQLLLTYLQICGDSYGISKSSNYNNNPSCKRTHGLIILEKF
jgi:hypothetical protein